MFTILTRLRSLSLRLTTDGVWDLRGCLPTLPFKAPESLTKSILRLHLELAMATVESFKEESSIGVSFDNTRLVLAGAEDFAAVLNEVVDGMVPVYSTRPSRVPGCKRDLSETDTRP